MTVDNEDGARRHALEWDLGVKFLLTGWKLGSSLVVDRVLIVLGCAMMQLLKQTLMVDEIAAERNALQDAISQVFESFVVNSN
jgi:hypothetical protein